MQTFQVLREIGWGHPFSGGLVVGGQGMSEQKSAINRMNILIATPGRLLQHMDETPNFACDNLQILGTRQSICISNSFSL